jgi:hypothetical protein
MTHKVDDWRGLYSEGWQGEIAPDAFSHPAKFSRALIRAIYDHAAGEGWLAAGDVVVDPFGGVALGGIDAMRLGCHWIGCELEQKFVDLGRANIELWESRYRAHFPAWGTARLLQGDSRQLAAHLAGAGLAVSSPPYAGSVNQSDQANDSGARIERKAAAGVDVAKPVNVGGPNSVLRRPQAYGNETGQLGAMPEGDYSATLAVSSPPYADGCTQEGTDKHAGRMEGTAFAPARYDLAVSSPPFAQQQTGGGLAKPDARYIDGTRIGSNCGYQNQGTTPGNLATLACSSPPFENSLDRGVVDPDARRRVAREAGISNAEHISPIDMENLGLRSQPDYGTTPGQMGADTGETFWTAARTIVEQTYQVLKPGGHAIWVVKAFVRNKQRVDFPGQWRALCEACGFVTLHEHRAWLVEEHPAQLDLWGNGHAKRVERKSFFRRLAESKGSPRIDWETVYCMVKPD